MNELTGAALVLSVFRDGEFGFRRTGHAVFHLELVAVFELVEGGQ